MLGEAGESGHEVAISQLALFDVLGVEGQGYLRFLDDLGRGDTIAEDNLFHCDFLRSSDSS